MSIKGDLRLKVNVNPGYIADRILKSKVYDTYTDCLLELAQEFQENSPVGASGQLKASWDVQNTPKRVAWGFEVKSNIVNTSERAINRIGGRAPGAPPPVTPLQEWVIAKGIESNPKKARGIAFAIRRKIMNEGTERYKKRENWVGIDNKGKRIPGGRLEQAEKEIAARLDMLFNQKHPSRSN